VNSSNIDVAAVTVEDIRAAAGRLEPYIHRTPLLSSRSLSEAIGVEVRLKCENLQRAGSFKIRGAMNALLQLSEKERRNGVVAFSSGNHAQGVALAAKLLGIKATIVMPENSVQMKVDATKAYGAEVVTAGVTSATRDTVAREIADKSGAAVIPPFDDWRIIAGAGTVGLEIVEEWPDVETIVTPLGGVTTTFSRSEIETFRAMPGMKFRTQPAAVVREPVDQGTLTRGGAIALAAALVVTLLAAVIGGTLGTRWHRRVDNHVVVD